MERVFIFVFSGSFLSSWLLGRLRRRSGTQAGRSLYGLLQAMLVTGVMLLDDKLHAGGITPSLLASDMLFLDALVLHRVRFVSEKKGHSYLFPLLAAAGLVRSVMALAGYPLPFDPVVHMTVVSGMMLSSSLAEEVVRMFPAGRLRGIPPEHVAFVFMKSVCAQVMMLLCVVILTFPSSRPLCRAASVLLAGMYAYLVHSMSRGTPVLRVMPVAAAVAVRHRMAGHERVTEESRRIDLLFERIETYMQQEKPFLDDAFSLTKLAVEMATNKSMLSKTINDKSGKNFCRYVNEYRIRYAVSLMGRDRRLKVSELALMSGFHTVASFNMAFKMIMNDTPSEYMRTLNSSRLARQEGGEQSAPPAIP